MGPLALINHALNFAAPALWLALCLPLLARMFLSKSLVSLGLLAQIALFFIVGVMVLGLGLVVFGRDGKMYTYLVLVIGLATCQWGMHKGWQR